jgi:hypothetical protein
VAAAVYVKARRKGGVLGFVLENRKREAVKLKRFASRQFRL